MNKVLLLGRITTKPELSQTPNGVATTRFNVAVNRQYTGADGTREADFIPIRVWRKQAENICNYLDKGSLIGIEGRIQTGSFTDKDGNKRSTWTVVADHVEFLGNKKVDKPKEEPKEESKEESDPFAEFGDEIEDNFLD